MKSLVVGLSVLFFIGGCNDPIVDKQATPKGKTEEVTFYIVRHGKTMLNTTDRVQGWSDAVLTPEGEKVVMYAGKGLKDIKFTSAYSSDSGRAVQTANLILAENKKSKVSLIPDERLREFNFGTYEGDLNETMWLDIAKSQGKTLEEWKNEGVSPKVFADSVAALDNERVEESSNWPAENYQTITKRLKASMDEIAKKESQKDKSNILLVSHGLSISALVQTLFEEYELPVAGIENASVTTIKYKNGTFKIDKVNDTSYIESGKK